MDEENEKLWATLKSKYQRQLILTLDALVGATLGACASAAIYILIEIDAMAVPGFWFKVVKALALGALSGSPMYLRQKPAAKSETPSASSVAK